MSKEFRPFDSPGQSPIGGDATFELDLDNLEERHSQRLNRGGSSAVYVKSS